MNSLYLPCYVDSWKYWWELNLTVGSQIDITKILHLKTSNPTRKERVLNSSSISTLPDDLHAELNGCPCVSPGQSEVGIPHHRVEVRGKQALSSREADTVLHQPPLLLTLLQLQLSKELLHLCSLMAYHN